MCPDSSETELAVFVSTVSTMKSRMKTRNCSSLMGCWAVRNSSYHWLKLGHATICKSSRSDRSSPLERPNSKGERHRS